MVKKRTFWALVGIAFLFSIAFRLIWVAQFSEISSVRHMDSFMLTTNDSYYWAEGARDILENSYLKGSLSPVKSAPSIITAFLAKILPVSFEDLIFYLPVVFSSFIVVPILLLSSHLRQIPAGFIAALVASIGVSYYNRTMAGYYDTDMLNIILPLMMVWSLSLALQTKAPRYMLFTGLEIVFYRWWYPQSYSLEFAFFGLILLYVLWKKRDSAYHYQLLALMLIAMMGLPDLMRLFGVLIVFGIFLRTSAHPKIWLGFAFAAFLFTGGFNPIWAQLKGYVFRDEILTTKEDVSLHFYTVMQTIREATHIPFETFAMRISGHWSLFLASMVGFVLLVRAHPVTLLMLPMLGLGFLAYVGGLRFTVYAVPIAAFGLGFVIMELARWLENRFSKERNIKLMAKVFILTATFVALYPNIAHIVNYRVPTVMNAQEVAQLEAFGSVTSQKDYTLGWWDYGYPIRYYANTQTLIDGGLHEGDANFPVSYSFFSDQASASNMAKFAVYYHAKRREIALKEKELEKDKRTIIPSTNIAWMMETLGYTNSNEFLKDLPHLNPPLYEDDIYIYLPFKMISILQTIGRFSMLDLMDGSPTKQPFIFFAMNTKDGEHILELAPNAYVDKRNGTITINNITTHLNKSISTSYDNSGNLTKKVQPLHEQGTLSLIFMQAYNAFLLVDKEMEDSTFIQLFVLENYNENYFTPVSLTPWAKIYKVKKQERE